MQPVEQRCPSVGNPGASHSLACLVPGAGANALFGPRAPCDPVASAGTGWRPRAARRLGPDASSHGCSNGCRGRNGCTTPPGCGSARKGTDGRDAHPYTPRTGRRCWTDSSQRATLRWHRLQRHGVGRGTVINKLACEEDRCRAHLLRLHRRCTAGARACHALCVDAVAAVPQRIGLKPATAHSKRSPSPAWPFNISQPRPEMSPNSKTLPRHRLTAVPDQRSQAKGFMDLNDV